MKKVFPTIKAGYIFNEFKGTIKDDNDLIYANQKCIEQMMDVENSAEVLTLYQTYFSYIKNYKSFFIKFLIIDIKLFNYLLQSLH